MNDVKYLLINNSKFKKKILMKDKVNDWMETLVKNYQLPVETKKEKPKKILTEGQKKIILNKK